MEAIPFWVFAVIILIFLSGYMAFRAMLAERKLDQQFIEREGKIYLERIQEARKKREASKQQESN
ncbi:sporulation YhaL family protein [Oceanobacillus massiliensis]|uniref:sporulation YhaL family protein n=1 Tax=Oceanobacillus massiliensis TaxID=1465765 RepID=UPI0002890826|nr:sporulation YhaL family protein [Oceanobacillus massiliensis]